MLICWMVVRCGCCCGTAATLVVREDEDAGVTEFSGCRTIRSTQSAKNEKKIMFFRPTMDPLMVFPDDGRSGDEKCIGFIVIIFGGYERTNNCEDRETNTDVHTEMDQVGK